MLNDIDKINEIVKSGDVESFIYEYENELDNKVMSIAKACHDQIDLNKIIMIAGPSSSGKTTFTLKLAQDLADLGVDSHTISLDNFYKDRYDLPKDDHGECDFECVNALDLEYLANRFSTLVKTGECMMPKFDFVQGKRIDNVDKVTNKQNSVFLIEGMHALNDIVVNAMPQHTVKKIYISVSTDYNKNDATFIDSRMLRLMRRLVRDYKYRGSSPDNTFSMWPGVIAGDIKYITPFKDRADTMIDTFFPYEAGTLKPFVTELLSLVKKSSPYYWQSMELLERLEKVVEIPDHYLPHSSLTREFIGESIYYADD